MYKLINVGGLINPINTVWLLSIVLLELCFGNFKGCQISERRSSKRRISDLLEGGSSYQDIAVHMGHKAKTVIWMLKQ